MKTGHLLYLTSMDREAFNTLNRRGHLHFLQRDVGHGVDRFGDQHALALSAFAYLYRNGTTAAVAAAAIDESWRDIMRISGAVASENGAELCGPRINNLGLQDSWASPHVKGGEGEPVVSTAVNLRLVWEWLQLGLCEIKKHLNPLPARDAEEA